MSLRMHDVLIWHCRGLTGRCKTTSVGGGCCRTAARARPGRSLTRQSCSRPATRPRRARRASSAIRPGRTWRKGLCRSMPSTLASRRWGFAQVRATGQFSHSNRLRLVGCRYDVNILDRPILLHYTFFRASRVEVKVTLKLNVHPYTRCRFPASWIICQEARSKCSQDR